MAKLILIRHGKSEWNKLGLWTGLTDVDLAAEGIEEAIQAGKALADLEIHKAYTSDLKRTQQTLEHALAALGRKNIETKSHKALNERDYGIYTGKNKWEVKELVGEATFQNMRRGWDVAIPQGETLKDVHARVVPYFEKEVMPDLKQGMNVMIVAHGNTLRALIKHLEELGDEAVADVEVGTGEVYVYDIDPSGKTQGKEVRSANATKGKM